MSKIVLQTEQLTKSYGALTAMSDLTLEIHEGEVLGLLGPNGAGKTTAISMMCGLLKPDAGRVFIHGKRVHGGAAEVRAQVGVCPQEALLWEKLTALEQLEFVGCLYGSSARVARQRGGDLLEALGLSAKADQLAGKLSGGMKRRLNLALALIHDPHIPVLDEPEAGLDPQSRGLVREYIRSLARKKTIILTTHNMDEADCFSKSVSQAFVIANFTLGFLMFLTGAAFPLPRLTLFTLFGRGFALPDLLPPTHAVIALNKVFTLGLGVQIQSVAFELAALTLLPILYFSLGVVLFQKTQMNADKH